MGHKYGFYSVKTSLEDVLNRTLNFWNENKGKVTNQIPSPNNLFYTINVKKDISMGSYGETYFMNIGFDPNDSTTYITMDVSLSFGAGMQWLAPQKITKKWAQYIGAEPMKLIRKQDLNFLKKLNEIKNMSGLSNQNVELKICKNCGKENLLSSNYCKSCGANIENI